MAALPVPNHQAGRRGHRPSPRSRPGRQRRVCRWTAGRRTSALSG